MAGSESEGGLVVEGAWDWAVVREKGKAESWEVGRGPGEGGRALCIV